MSIIIINEKVRKTSSLFLILSLVLNFSVYGLFFNLNIDQIKNAKVSLTKNAKAAPTASTTVTVKNSPPVFVQNPYEVVTSSSTSPVNVGGSISFGLADNAVTDQESNDFALLVCAPGATATTSGGIRCVGGTQFCVSSLASSSPTNSSSTSCTYNNVPDPGASELQNWNAFVCDNHPLQPGCANANSGSGDNGSPYYVDHTPTVVSATTTVNNVDPGSAFTVSAVLADADTQGGADDLAIAVCATNAWSTSTHSCTNNDTYCTSTLASGATHTCIATTTIPLTHGAKPYYVFAWDWHSFSGSSNQGATYNVNDVAPVVSDVRLNNSGATITLNVKGPAGDKFVYATSSSVGDNNGCADITSASTTVYESATAGGYNCSPNDNNCYASTSCVISDCAGGSDTTVTVTCGVALKYFAQATDAANSNPRAGDIWSAGLKVTDGTNVTIATNTSQSIEVLQLPALEISETFIDYGTLVSGTSTGNYNATTTINNFGNVPIDSQVYGTDMVRALGGTIAANNQKFGATSANYSALPTALGTTPFGPVTTLNVIKPTSTAASQKWMYWGIFVPGGLMSGDYGGINTFSAVVNASGTW